MQYEAYESKYELYAICGDGVQSNISGYDLVQGASHFWLLQPRIKISDVFFITISENN